MLSKLNHLWVRGVVSVVMLLSVGCDAARLASGTDGVTGIEVMNARMEGVVEWKREKMNVRLNVRMVTDSMIWISVQPLAGLEVARVTLMPDSVRILNRMTRMCASAAWSEVHDQWHWADYSTLQQGIMGFVVHSKEGRMKRFSYQGLKVRMSVVDKGLNQRAAMVMSIPNGYEQVSMEELLNDII